MAEDRIRAALRVSTDTESVVIGLGALASIEQVFQASFGDRGAVVIADENTYAAAGAQVQQHFKAAGRSLLEPCVFPGLPTLYAEYGNVEKLRETLRAHEAIPVVVASGTLNDIVKRAAYECDRRYMTVATAASMDGYTAFGASITKAGYKQTLTCPAPKAVVADLDVLTGAPARGSASGYGDLLGKVPAGADWIIADELGIEVVDTKVWSLVQGRLREAIGRPADLQAGQRQAVEDLIKGLIMSGLAMQAHSSSRPASGAEHQFSHLWEMEGLGLHDEPPLSHGFKVGLASIAIAALYERLLTRDLAALDIPAICRSWPGRKELERRVRAAHTTPGLDEAAVIETLSKYVDAVQLRQRLELLRDRWPQLRRRLKQQLLPAAQLRDMLQAAGCPTHPSQIGLSLSAFRETYVRAQMIRRRYTVLDLATETDTHAGCIDELFGPGGFWAPAAG